MSSYAAVRFAETAGYLTRRRGMRWMVPLGAALMASFYGSKVGLRSALAELDTQAAVRRAQKRIQLQATAVSGTE